MSEGMPMKRGTTWGAVASVWLLIATGVCSAQSGGAADPQASDGKIIPAPPARSQPSGSLSVKDALVFRNGDFLYGALQSIDPENGVRWRHAQALGPIDFNTNNVSQIYFRSRGEREVAKANMCRVQLVNEDELEGSLISCDRDKVVLETWYAGKLEIPRKVAQVIRPVPADRSAIYEGPTGLDGWTMGKVAAAVADPGEWKYRNGAFYAARSASIARDLNLPDVASIQFDLAWKGMFQLNIALYTDYLQPVALANKELEPKFGGFYSLQLNNYFVNLYPIKQHDPLKSLGQTTIPVFNRKTSAHLEIRVSKAKRLVALSVDGVLVKQWTDSDEFAGEGTGLRFVYQGQAQGAIRLNNLSITEWDSQFEEPPTHPADTTQDLAKLRNGDRVAGLLESIRDGKITVEMAGRQIRIPLERVKQIELARQKVDRVAGDLPNVRAFFARGGSVAFQLTRWDEQGVQAIIPNIGKVNFNPAAFTKIDFDLNRKTSDPVKANYFF
jgi:ribosome maturation factor RimP